MGSNTRLGTEGVCKDEELAVWPEITEVPTVVSLITVTVVPGAKSNKAAPVAFATPQHSLSLWSGSWQQNCPSGQA